MLLLNPAAAQASARQDATLALMKDLPPLLRKLHTDPAQARVHSVLWVAFHRGGCVAWTWSRHGVGNRPLCTPRLLPFVPPPAGGRPGGPGRGASLTLTLFTHPFLFVPLELRLSRRPPWWG